jgi:hypothetical protein
MTEERVFIYASGPDSPLRAVGWSLLAEGIAVDIDLCDQAPLFLGDGGKRKVGASGRSIVIVGSRTHAQLILERLRGVATAAYALPILASL